MPEETPFHTTMITMSALSLLKKSYRSVFWIGLTMIAIPECFTTLILAFQSVGYSHSIIETTLTAPIPHHFQVLLQPLQGFISTIALLSFVQGLLVLFAYLALSHVALDSAHSKFTPLPLTLKKTQKHPWFLFKVILTVGFLRFLENLFQIPLQLFTLMTAIGLTWLVVEPSAGGVRKIFQSLSLAYSVKISKFRVFLTLIVIAALFVFFYSTVLFLTQEMMLADQWLSIPSRFWLMTISETPISYTWCLSKLIQISCETALICIAPFISIAILDATMHKRIIQDH